MRGLTLIIVLVIGLGAGYYGRTLRPADAPQAPSGGEVATSEPAADAGPGDAVRWKLASSFAATMPILGPSIDAFISNVYTTSGGNKKIKFFDPGALVPPLEVFDAVASGSVDMGYSTPGFWAGKEAALQLFSAVPFGPASAEYMAWFYFGGGKAEFEAIYAKHNI